MKIIFLFVLVILGNGLAAQLMPVEVLDTIPHYTSMEEALKNPKKVVALDLSKQKLEKIPSEIANFTNLQKLVLRKNKLDTTVFDFSKLSQLQILDISKNKLSYFPESITKLILLKKLSLQQNFLVNISENIGALNQLEYFDLWSNSIDFFPIEMEDLTALKWMDLRVVEMTQNEQEQLVDRLPDAKIFFSAPCNCSD